MKFVKAPYHLFITALDRLFTTALHYLILGGHLLTIIGVAIFLTAVLDAARNAPDDCLTPSTALPETHAERKSP